MTKKSVLNILNKELKERGLFGAVVIHNFYCFLKKNDDDDDDDDGDGGGDDDDDGYDKAFEWYSRSSSESGNIKATLY
ncbi:hypothetical protein RCL_jg17816.t1 [Rhizophagus clarus]|uniref:Uncharacterized protein n=1 Tax=Rhizophagus clarus TaxID=94130 RepID=A0A8H3QIV7_9GLOM|nr:hypothetical protein RCL_jg17816.t1 [Rhizophagus clarus]